MKYLYPVFITITLSANTYVLDPVYSKAKEETNLSNKELLESKLQLQETAPGLYNPIINGLQGDKISLTVDGLRFSNAIFRSGPNQYFSWIPQEFVNMTEIMPTSDAIGSTLNTELGIEESKVYYQFDQYNTGSTAVAKMKVEDTSIGLKVQDTKEYNDEPHTSYNQNAVFLEQEFLHNKAKFLYSESNDIDRPDKYLKDKPYTWEKQYYLLLKDQVELNNENIVDISYQRFYEKVNDKGNLYKTIDDMYGFKYNNYFSDDLNIFVSDYYEDIEHKDDSYKYNTLSAGAEYGHDINEQYELYLRYNLSYAYASWGTQTKEFVNNAVSLEFDAEKTYVRYDFGYKFPTLQNLAYAQTTGKGIDLPNNNLKQEKSHTITVGYRDSIGQFKYSLSAFYMFLTDLIEREKQSYQIDGEDVYKSSNVDHGYMYGSNVDITYKYDNFSALLNLAYVYGKTDEDYISKLTPFKLFYKMSYNNYYLRWKYAPKSHTLSQQDKADVRIEDPRYNQYNNDGYNTIDLGTKYIFQTQHIVNIDLNNIFNNDGRVLGSSVDVPEQSISLRYSYIF